MSNFKTETESWIAKLLKDGSITNEIDELFFFSNGLDYAQRGGTINWEAARKDLGLENWEYDSGFGCQEFEGFITFKDSNIWLEREEYDGSEWWALRKKPTLKD